MKRLALNVLAVIFCMCAFVTGTLAEKCDRLISYDLGVVKESIEADLTNGTWTTDLTGNPSSMYFHADGSVETFRTEKRKDRIEVATWEIKMVEGQAVLRLSAPDGTQRTLRINPTCEGFAAIDAFGSATELFKVDDYNSLLHNQTRRQVIGNWTTVAQSDLNADRAISWHFNANGTFELAVAPNMYHVTHRGVWDLSPTGEYIILYFTNHEDPESVYAAELLKVKTVDFEDLVIDSKVVPRILTEFSSGKALHFEKNFSL